MMYDMWPYAIVHWNAPHGDACLLQTLNASIKKELKKKKRKRVCADIEVMSLLYNSYIGVFLSELSSLMAWGKKLLLSLVVLQRILL